MSTATIAQLLTDWTLIGLAALALGCVWVMTTAACRYAEAEYQATRRRS